MIPPTNPASSIAATAEAAVLATGRLPLSSGLIPVLWVCGPCGVGKTAVGWEIFSQLDRAGIPVGYVDIDQLGMCYPAPADDPHTHQVKVDNVAATVATFRAAGAQCVVVSGTVDVDKAHTYAGQIPGAALTLCRLRVGHDDQKMRLAERGWSSDMLAEATQEAEALDHSDFADMSIDTSGLPILQVTRLVREQAGGWPALTKQTHVSRLAFSDPPRLMIPTTIR